MTSPRRLRTMPGRGQRAVGSPASQRKQGSEVPQGGGTLGEPGRLKNGEESFGIPVERVTGRKAGGSDKITKLKTSRGTILDDSVLVKQERRESLYVSFACKPIPRFQGPSKPSAV